MIGPHVLETVAYPEISILTNDVNGVKNSPVMVSSLAAAGPSPSGRPMTEDVAPVPISHYGASKLEGEIRLKHSLLASHSVIVRPAVVYGPRDTDVLEFFRMARRGWLPRSRLAWVAGPVAVASLAGLFVVVSQGSPAATDASISTASDTAAHAQPAPTDHAKRVLVVGDSVAFTVAQGLSRIGERLYALRGRFRGGDISRKRGLIAEFVRMARKELRWDRQEVREDRREEHEDHHERR